MTRKTNPPLSAKHAPGLLVGILLIGCFTLWLPWQSWHWKQQQWNDSPTEKVIFTLSSTQYHHLHWVKPGKEFLYQGTMYDIDEQQNHHNTYLLRCHADPHDLKIHQNRPHNRSKNQMLTSWFSLKAIFWPHRPQHPANSTPSPTQNMPMAILLPGYLHRHDPPPRRSDYIHYEPLIFFVIT